MVSERQLLIRRLLRERGPLNAEELLPLLAEAGYHIISRNPKATLANSFQNDFFLVSAGEGRWAYLPAAAEGATMLVPMPDTPPQDGLVVPVEVAALLSTSGVEYQDRRSGPVLLLREGPGIHLPQHLLSHVYAGFDAPLEVPPEFWRWWHDQQRATTADALAVRCLTCPDDAPARFAVEPCRSADLDARARQQRDAAVREAAMQAVKRTDGLEPRRLTERLIARGVYHPLPPPHDLHTVLFEPPGPFFVERGTRVVYRPEITPAFRRVFAARIAAQEGDGDLLAALLGGAGGWGGAAEEAAPDEAPEYVSPHLDREPEQVYQLKVTLGGGVPPSRQRKKAVSRTIEILDSQSFEELHDAIRDSFDWDDDHLYSFFMSGRRWDQLTEIPRDPEGEEPPPAADEVAIGDLELQPGQHFLYLYDYGDEWLCDVEVQAIAPSPKRGEFPRIVEREGKAPPQYPSWE